MKNKLKLLLLPILLLGVTACGSSKPTLQSAIDKTNKAKNYHMDYKIDMEIESEGMTMAMPITMGLDVDLDTKLAKGEVSVSILGMKVTVDEYLDMKNNIIYVKDPSEENKWTKQKADDMDLSNVIGNVENSKLVDETDTEYHYQATVTPKDFQKNLELMGSTGTTDGLELTKDVTIDIYVNKKENYVTKYEADLSDSIKIDEDVEYKKLKFSISFSELNNVSVKSIDQSIIDNAVEEE